MHSLAWFGRLIGGLSVAAGALVIALALLSDSQEGAVRDFQRCEMDRRLGIRAAPCPPPAAGVDRPLLIGAGAGAIASGVFFLLLSGILVTLVEMQGLLSEEIRRSREVGRPVPTSFTPATASAPPAQPGGRYVNPRFAPAPGQPPDRYINPKYAPPADAPGMPSRFAMIADHGQLVGGRAWDIMEGARQKGITVPVEDAVREAKRQQG